jgi:hypothetical protein
MGGVAVDLRQDVLPTGDMEKEQQWTLMQKTSQDCEFVIQTMKENNLLK